MMNSIKVKYKMDTIFMHSGISKISESYRQLLNLLDKINLKGSVSILLYQILSSTTHG